MAKPELPRREGFWWSKYDRFLPKPIPNDKPWKGKAFFLARLRKVQSESDARRPRKMSKGWSNCRCCGEKNGSTTFEYKGWRWPDGLRHYVEKHNVRPSLAFQEFILNQHLTEE